MKSRLMFHSVPVLALFLALTPIALASNTWYIDGVNGSDNNDCKSPQTACKTIGHAISLASSGDAIRVAAATYKENLSIGLSLKVVGSGANTTIIDGGGVNTVVRISSATAHVTLSKVTVQNGSVTNGRGGGIYNGGTLTINNSTLSRNSVDYGFGGGIYNTGTLTINNSTLSGNSASGFCIRLCSAGAGIYNGGTLTVNNSTLSENSATSLGGGIFGYFGTATISNSTVSGNSAVAGAGIYKNSRSTAALQNSVVANNSGGNCNGTMTSNGYNLSSDGTCNFNGTGDLNNTVPKLGKLGSYGGPTQTIPLLSGSPAIDSGNPNGCTDGHGHLLKTDQRGKPRPDKEDTGGCDMGAYERQKD
jgi:hypothetical protein